MNESTFLRRYEGTGYTPAGSRGTVFGMSSQDTLIEVIRSQAENLGLYPTDNSGKNYLHQDSDGRLIGITIRGPDFPMSQPAYERSLEIKALQSGAVFETTKEPVVPRSLIDLGKKLTFELGFRAGPATWQVPHSRDEE